MSNVWFSVLLASVFLLFFKISVVRVPFCVVSSVAVAIDGHSLVDVFLATVVAGVDTATVARIMCDQSTLNTNGSNRSQWQCQTWAECVG